MLTMYTLWKPGFFFWGGGGGGGWVFLCSFCFENNGGVFQKKGEGTDYIH